jgi:lipopolysaccharide export system permease protein
MGFVIYYNLINLSQAWVSSAKIGLGLALALVHGSALLLALSLIGWRDHGAVWRPPWARRAA